MRWIGLWMVVGCTGVSEPGTSKPTTIPPPGPTTPPPPTSAAIDADGDGYAAAFDCDDTDPDVHPEAYDAPYDGIDADCAEDSDFDADGDGFDSDAYGGTDCDDMASDVLPGGTEACDGRDGDCDGTVDSPPPLGSSTWYLDADADGFGDVLSPVVACDAPPAHVSLDTDCDDTSAEVYPFAPDVPCDGLDNDCDETTLEPSGGANIGAAVYPSLVDAVAAAVPGDVVETCEGLHEVGGLILGSQIEIRGQDRPETTRISAVGFASTIRVVTTDLVTLTNVTVADGRGTTVVDELQGGGLHLMDGADVRLVNTTIEGNQAEHGAGIYGGDGVLLSLVDSQIRGNSAFSGFGRGGGIELGEGALLTLDESSIRDNEANFSCGGVSLGANSVLQGIGLAEVTNNLADLTGGGVCADDGATLEGVTISFNEAISGGGIDGADLVIRDSWIESNVGTVSAGGIQGREQILLERTTIDANLGSVDVGGMSITGQDSVVELVDCVITNNEGLALFADVGGVELFGASLISTNTDWGSGLDLNEPTAVGMATSGTTYTTSGVVSFTCDDSVGVCQ